VGRNGPGQGLTAKDAKTAKGDRDEPFEPFTTDCTDGADGSEKCSEAWDRHPVFIREFGGENS